jgi:hypothetical protein
MRMITNSQNEKGSPEKRNAGMTIAVGLAVVLCVGCCALLLLIPTASTSVDTVYQGF